MERIDYTHSICRTFELKLVFEFQRYVCGPIMSDHILVCEVLYEHFAIRIVDLPNIGKVIDVEKIHSITIS